MSARLIQRRGVVRSCGPRYFKDVCYDTYKARAGDLDHDARIAVTERYQRRLRFYQQLLLTAFVLRDLALIDTTLLAEYKDAVEGYDKLAQLFWPDGGGGGGGGAAAAAKDAASARANARKNQATVKEMKLMKEGECCISVTSITSAAALFCPERRLPPPGADAGCADRYLVKEAVIASSDRTHGKFSQLTLNMIRMMQLLEHTHTPKPLAHGGAGKKANKRHRTTAGVGAGAQQSQAHGAEGSPPPPPPNPHKHLLYRPAARKVLMHIQWAAAQLAAGEGEGAGEGAALLVYLCAKDAYARPGAGRPGAGESRLYDGGLVFNDAPTHSGDTSKKHKVGSKADECIHPGDLVPFTRAPVFLIIDGPGAAHFTCMEAQTRYGDVFVALLSPPGYPDGTTEPKMGTLFAFFLHAPLEALAYLAGVHVRLPDQARTDDEAVAVQQGPWKDAAASFAQLVAAAEALLTGAGTPAVYGHFAQDPFLRRLLARFVVLHHVYEMHHKLSAGPEDHCPRAIPHLGSSVRTRSAYPACACARMCVCVCACVCARVRMCCACARVHTRVHASSSCACVCAGRCCCRRRCGHSPSANPCWTRGRRPPPPRRCSTTWTSRSGCTTSSSS